MKKTLLASLLLMTGTGMAISQPLKPSVDASHNHARHVLESAGHWMAPRAMAKRKNPVKPNKASLQRGQALFQTHCAGCHGERGRGDGTAGTALMPKPANLATMAPLHRDGDLAWKIAEGRGPMPGWKETLRPRQIWDLVNYIKRLPKS